MQRGEGCNRWRRSALQRFAQVSVKIYSQGMERIFGRRASFVVLFLLLAFVAVKADAAFSTAPGSAFNARSLKRINDELAGADRFSFAVFADPQNSRTVFHRLIDGVNESAVDFSVLNGDLVNNGYLEYYRLFMNDARRFKAPMVTNIGNRDAYSGGRALYYEILGPFYYSFAVGNSLFVIVDNSDGNFPDRFQAEWLEARLNEAEGYAHCFVFMHKPLRDERQRGLALDHAMEGDAGQRLNELLDRFPVTMLFCSHVHEYRNGVWGETPFTITGGAGGELAGTEKEHHFFHYVVVEVEGYEVSYKVVRLDAPRFSVVNRLFRSTVMGTRVFITEYFVWLIMLVGLYYLTLLIFLGWRRREVQDNYVSPS